MLLQDALGDVADLPSDGDGGDPCLAVDNGTNWVRVNLGSAVSATDVEEYLTAE